jgi:hypothetical protein
MELVGKLTVAFLGLKHTEEEKGAYVRNTLCWHDWAWVWMSTSSPPLFIAT